MAIDVEIIEDPHNLILDVSVVDEEKLHARILITYAESEPWYKLETRPLGATLTLKEGRSRRKVILRFSGLPFPARNLIDRIDMVARNLKPGQPRTDALASRN